MKRHTVDSRGTAGWPAIALSLGIPTYLDIVKHSPAAGFPVSGDALSRFTRAQMRSMPAPDVAMTWSKRTGRRSSGVITYEEAWAERHQIGQTKIERGRLADHKARHRSHYQPLDEKAAS